MPEAATAQQQRLKLIQLLGDLPKGQFEEFCFALGVSTGDIPSAVADQKSRAKALLDWVSGPNGCGWPTFLEALKSIVPGEKFDPEALAISAIPTAPNNTPLKGTNHFVGRDLDLQRLHEHLQQSQSVAITAVVGMGGIGKTELALQYVRAHLEDYPGGICWLESRDRDITAQILVFAERYFQFSPSEDLPLEARIAICWDHWPGQTQALVVIDDVTDYQKIEPYLPRSDRFARLLTTRQQRLATTVNDLNINVLAEPDALELLKELAGTERIDAEPEPAKHLCEWLGYLPLALELVGHYLAQSLDLSLTELQAELISEQLETDALVKAEPGMTNVKGVASAFELSWKKLSPQAQELACLLSCFALAPIPWQRVTDCLPKTDVKRLTGYRDQELQKFSLLKRIEVGYYQYHQLLQRFIRTKLSKTAPPVSPLRKLLRRFTGNKQTGNTHLIAAYCKAMVAAAKEIDQTPTQAQCLAWSELVPHVGETIETWLTQVSDKDLIWPFVGLGRFYNGQGLYDQAEPWREQCLSVTQERLGEEHPDVATSLNNLAVLYGSQGRYDAAEPLYADALAMRKQLLGEKHPDVASSLNNLAGLYESQGRYETAELLYADALAMRKQLLGNEHPDVATNLNNLAGLYESQGRYDAAEPLYVEALAMRKRLLDEEHPDVATSLNDLAVLYGSQGRYDAAEPLLEEALAMRKRLLGEEHPDVATSLNNLAGLYSSQGHYDAAEPLLEEALAMRKRLLGEEHPDVATSLNSLAKLYREQGRYDAAESLYVEALTMRKRLLGEEHPDVATSLDNLAGLYSSQYRYDAAEPLYADALAMRKQLLGEEHPDVATSLNNLAQLYYSQGRYDAAEPLYVEALAMGKRLLGEEHPDVVSGLNNLAVLYYSQGLYDAAEPLLEEALAMRKRLLGEEHPDVATSLNNLAGLYSSQDRHDAAEPLLEEALAIWQRLLGEEHPNTKMTLGNLIVCVRKAMEAGQADTLSDHPMTQNILQWLKSQND